MDEFVALDRAVRAKVDETQLFRRQKESRQVVHGFFVEVPSQLSGVDD